MESIITIVTPSFNQVLFIGETIKSVLSQEGDFYIDYIIADGGSTDGSVEIIKKYDEAMRQGKIKILCKGITYRWWSRKDRGQSAALNEAFKQGKGAIFAWINSDDGFLPNAFKSMIRAFNVSDSPGMVYGDAVCADQVRNKRTVMETFQGGFRELSTDNYIYQSSVFFKKEIFDKVGGADESMHYAFDYDLWVKISKQGRMLYIPEILSWYTIWEQAKTYAQTDKSWKERALVNRRYNMKSIDPRIGYAIAGMSFSKFIKRHFPRLYSSLRIGYGRLTNRNA